jgi:hypothetical protein
MPVALEFGGTPVKLGELQGAVEDYTASQSAEFGVEHDHQGRHTKPLQELTVTGDSALNGAVTMGGDVLATGEFDYTLTANTDDLTKADGSPIAAVVIRLQAATPYTLSGIVPPSNNVHLRLLENGGNEVITLLHNADSEAPNRFSLPFGTDYELSSGQIALAKYDPHSEIWRVLTSGGSSVLRSIQRGTILITAGNSSETATIAAVTESKCDLSSLGSVHTVDASMAGVRLDLITPTTVSASRVGTTGDLLVGYQVVEYA